MMRPELTMSVYLCREPVDMRKSIDGLSLLVQEAMELNPFDEAVFVFCNRQRDKVKILAWERYDIARMQPHKSLFFDAAG